MLCFFFFSICPFWSCLHFSVHALSSHTPPARCARAFFGFGPFDALPPNVVTCARRGCRRRRPWISTWAWAARSPAARSARGCRPVVGRFKHTHHDDDDSVSLFACCVVSLFACCGRGEASRRTHGIHARNARTSAPRRAPRTCRVTTCPARRGPGCPFAGCGCGCGSYRGGGAGKGTGMARCPCARAHGTSRGPCPRRRPRRRWTRGSGSAAGLRIRRLKGDKGRLKAERSGGAAAAART